MLLMCTLFVRTATAQETTEKGPKIEFIKLEHDFGTILQDANGTCTFEFKNTGDAPLIIAYAKTSCGCLVPQWPIEPIAPGAKGKITLKYDTKRVGPINKSATVSSNAINAPTLVIRIKGTVKPLPEPETPVNNTGTPVNN
jgi:hypothetical protein